MIVGRTAELEAIDAFLASSGGGVLLLEGELGAGKTALWREAVARASVRVLACRPAEAETSMAYAALGDLVGEASLDGLPEPQRHALAVALLREEPRGPQSQRAVALGLLGVLGQAPTLVAIDDVQWLDGPTATVLAFVARRFSGWLLLARRGGGPLPLGLESARRVVVGPLGEADVSRLLGVSRAEGARVHRDSGGNPYYALELHSHGEVPADLRALVERAPGRPLAGGPRGGVARGGAVAADDRAGRRGGRAGGARRGRGWGRRRRRRRRSWCGGG